MSRHGPPLGDSHNFGRRVARHGDSIVKPRTVVWERLLLDRRSPLRRLLDDAAERDGLGREALSFLPDVRVESSAAGPGGVVDAIQLEPLGTLSSSERDTLARIAGRSIALWSWLGVTDLHWENLVLGADARGRMVFTPIDIESLFDDLALPTETKLLPDAIAEPDDSESANAEYAALCQHACGIRRLLPYLGKPVGASTLLAMAAAYHRMLAFLDRNADDIARAILELESLPETPIRVCLRSTGTYVEARTKPPWPPLLDAEREQMERGDIPYFFRFYDRPGIHYYRDASLQTLGRLPLEGDVPQLEPLLGLHDGLASANRRSLREEGFLTLLAAFDHPGLHGEHRHAAGSGEEKRREDDGELSVLFGESHLLVGLPSGEEIESDRDLSAFVSSVYLPCRCGEVRSVFVPATTTCDADPGEV